jgi:potassium efflux system protein
MTLFLKHRPLGLVCIFILLLTILQPLTVSGQDTSSGAKAKPPSASETHTSSVSLESLKVKRSKVEASKDLDKNLKDSTLKLLDQAIGFSELSDELNRRSKFLAQQIKSAPARIKNIQAELSRPFDAPEAVNKTASKITAEMLQQQLQKEQAQLAAVKDLLAGWKDQLDQQKDLLEQLPQKISGAKARLTIVNQNLKSPPPAGEPEVVTESRHLMLESEQLKLTAETKLYEQQLNSHDLLASLYRAEIDLTSREIAEREEIIKARQNEVAERVHKDASEARRDAEEARDKIPESASAVKEQYDINIALSKELEELSPKVTEVARNLEKVTDKLQQIEEDFALASERIESLELTEASGLALRRQRQLLPGANNFRKSSAERRRLMSRIRENQYGLEQQRRVLTDLDTETDEVVDLLVFMTPDKAEAMRPEVHEILTNRRLLLEKLLSGYNQYFKGLQNIEFAEQQLVARAKEYADFLDTHLVWIRSSRILSIADFKNSAEVLQAFINPAYWRRTLNDARDSVASRPGPWILGLLLSVILLFGSRWARREMSRTAEKVKQPSKDRLSLTFWALALTVYLMSGFPFLTFFIGWRLLQLPGPHDFTQAIATGMIPAASIWATLLFVYHLCRRDGLAHIHFKWPQSIRQTLQLNLKWFAPLAVTMAFLISAMSTIKEIEFANSTAEMALIVMMIANSIFLGWVLRFSGGIVSRLLKNYPGGWLARLRYIWWPVVVGMPLFMAILTGIGYFLTALQLRGYIRYTVLLVMTSIIINSLSLRWLALARRNFAIREARRKAKEKREENRRKQVEKHSLETDDKAASLLHPEPEIGLAEIDEQTSSILRTIMFFIIAIGLWAIWEPVFPAFGILQKIELWSYTGVVDGVSTNVPISLSNLVMAIVAVVITVIAAKNLPGLLEITILNRLGMDAGGRHAFSTLCRYAITAIGIIVAFNTIGFKWSSIQWLIAALGVGLGFGLQEIVANFISGIIVLFERPFRVGDTVTVGNVSGTVSRIRIRATNILDWDRKELIVPNKEFITGQLVNWSLADPISRFIIKVGIAYGSDVELAEKLLLKVLDENPLVLKEPKPTAYFLGFGESSLDFELRIFISNIDHWMPARHQLHKAIDREFRKAGIVIAFPQRDVHFDSTQPLRVQVVPEGADPKSDESKTRPDET